MLVKLVAMACFIRFVVVLFSLFFTYYFPLLPRISRTAASCLTELSDDLK